MKERKRIYHRWANIENDREKMVALTQTTGADVLAHGKNPWSVWFTIVVRTTPNIMRRVEEAWAAAGFKWKRRQPRGAYRVCLRGDEEPLRAAP